MVQENNETYANKISPPKKHPTEAPDPQTAEANRILEQDSDTHFHKLVNLQLEQDLGERKKYAKKIYHLMIGWIFAILVIVFCQGISWPLNFNLTNSVLVALIAGTTVNIFGVFMIVAKYLFPGTQQSQISRIKRKVTKEE